MKSEREQMDIVATYEELGSLRATARVLGTTHKTVRRVLERRAEGRSGYRERGPRNTDCVAEIITAKVKNTDGRITAKRLLPVCRTAGYAGSARNLRRAVAAAKVGHRRTRRIYRPWVPVPGEHLVIDWGKEGPFKIFCAVMAWSRYRFVRFASDERLSTTLALLAECFEELGGVPAVVLADRMGCLKAGVVAGQVIPTSDYVRLATHFAFRPDFCHAADPESKGVVESLVGYVKSDLIVPTEGFTDLDSANEAAGHWCAEVNNRVHSETGAIPLQRLSTERAAMRPLPSLRPPIASGVRRKVDRLSCIRFGSARYSVPHRLVGASVEVVARAAELVIVHEESEVARHRLVSPGEVSLEDEHYGSARERPSRVFRPRTATEIAFLSLGPSAEPFLRAAAAAGTPRLAGELEGIVSLCAAYGQEATEAALGRALAFSRFSAADVRAILEAGAGVPRPVRRGRPLALSLPAVPVRPLSAYAMAKP